MNTIKMVSVSKASEGLNSKTLSAMRGIVKRSLKWQDGLVEELATHGVTTRDMARPFVVVIIAELYGVGKVEEGQRGYKLPRDSASDKAAGRFLDMAFGSDNPFKGGKKGAAAEVTLPRGLLSGVKELVIAKGTTKAQFNALLKAMREEITFA